MPVALGQNANLQAQSNSASANLLGGGTPHSALPPHDVLIHFSPGPVTKHISATVLSMNFVPYISQ